MADFYHIKGHGRPQGGPPVPPQHPRPQPQADGQPSQPLSFQQRPVDPRIVIPNEFGRFIEVSDLTAANLGEDQYFQYLSTPIAIRFEKTEPQVKYDSTGERMKPTWLTCTRRLLPQFDSVQADEEIQRLNRKDSKKGVGLLKKTLSLGPNARNQVTTAERDLAAAVQDPRFRIVLKQLDTVEKPIVQHHRTGSKHCSGKKTRKERVSITAYFSQCPKPDQVPSRLYRQLMMEKSHQECDILARREREEREERAREKREDEEKMAEQHARQEQARTDRIRAEQMMSNDQTGNRGPQQQPFGGHPGQAMHPSQVPQGQQRGIGQQMPYTQGHLPINPHQRLMSQKGLLPQEGPMHQQHAHFQPNKGQHPQGQPQRLPNVQARPPQPSAQMGQPQGPPPGMRQMPPPHHQQQHGRHPPTVNRPIITVHTEHRKRSQHECGRSPHSSSRSSTETPSIFSDSERSSESRSSSFSPGSSKMAKAGGSTIRPNRPTSSASQYLVDLEKGRVHDAGRETQMRRRHSATRRRAEKSHVQTGSDRRPRVGLSPRRAQSPGVFLSNSPDPLAQVRDAFKLVAEVSKLDAATRRNQPAAAAARPETLPEADRLDHLQPRKYRARPLGGGSETQFGGGARTAQIFPHARRVTASEVGRQVNRDRARDLERDFLPQTRGVGLDRDLRYDERDLEDSFARVRRQGRAARIGDSDVDTFRERQRWRESFARDDQEEILRSMGENGRWASPDRSLFRHVHVPQGRSDGRFDARGGGLGP